MKKFVTILVVFAMLGVTTANAKNKSVSPSGIALMKSSTGFKLFYKNEEAGIVKVTIYNNEGEAMFTETINNTDGFVRPYNFSSLKDGDYTVELVDKNGKSVHHYIHKKKSTVEKNLSYLTKVEGATNKYVLSIPNEGRQLVTVRIFTKDEELLHSERLDINGNFAQLYNLGEVSDDIVFEVNSKSGGLKRLEVK